MDEWTKLSERISAFIRDRTDFIVVAKPETLVVRNVERIMRTLAEYNVGMRGMVINCVMEQADSEMLRSMRSAQIACIAELKAAAGNLPVAMLPLSNDEMRGIQVLRRAGGIICEQLGIDQ